MSRRVLVTGAGGYIGRHVVNALLKRGDQVAAVCPSMETLPPGVDHIGDDFAALDLKALVPTLDSCIHLAWRDGFQHDADSHMAHLSEHYAFLTGLAAEGLSSLTALGTMHEIGYWEGAIDDNTPASPRSLYGIAKNALRQALTTRLHNTSVNFRWLRAFYIVGDDSRSQSLFAKILKWEAEGKKTFPFTSGLNAYDFILVSDLADQIVAADSQTLITGTINCCSGEPVALKDRVMSFISEHGLSLRPEYGAFPDRPYDSPGVWGDSSKIKRILSEIST